MDEELAVIVTGFDVDQRRAEAGLIGVFGLEAARARRFVRELPVVAKTCANRAAAERYAQALRSIGARVEIESAASAAAEGKPSPSSLPIPAPSMMARLDESTRVERETLRAIERFRAGEGLDAGGDEPPLDLDPVNPSIPRAPAVPHDLAKMPNAKLPRWSERPAWMMTDPLEQGEEADVSETRSPRPHNDAKPPPPPPPAQQARSSARPGAAGSHSGGPEPARSMRPSTVGLAHAAKASVRPGIGLLSWWRITSGDARRRRLHQACLAAVALVVLVAGALWLWPPR